MKKLIIFIVCAVALCACGGSSEQKKPTDESKALPASSLVFKGKHAKLFKLVGETYTVNLVNAGDDGWQVRVKMKIANQTLFSQIKDNKNYERELKGAYGELLNSSDVELESLDMNRSDWEELIQEDEEMETTVSGKTWSYKRLSYEDAKEIFDNTVSVQISGLELKPREKSSPSKLLDDDTKEALDDVKDLIEMEGELLNALGGMF